MPKVSIRLAAAWGMEENRDAPRIYHRHVSIRLAAAWGMEGKNRDACVWGVDYVSIRLAAAWGMEVPKFRLHRD